MTDDIKFVVLKDGKAITFEEFRKMLNLNVERYIRDNFTDIKNVDIGCPNFYGVDDIIDALDLFYANKNVYKKLQKRNERFETEGNNKKVHTKHK